MNVQLPKVVEVKGQRVLTTEQLAKCYDTVPKIIQYNFSYNKQRYTEGKHFILLQGAELKQFKANLEIQGNLKFARILYLWTEKGALLHAKSLNTDKAWEVYDYLVDFYFREREQREILPVKARVEKSGKRVSKKIDIEQDVMLYNAIQKIRKDLICMDVLLRECMCAKWESAYNKQKSVAMDVVGFIVKDFNSMADLEPKIVEELYY